jgi:glucose/arabinose dehydrogenase
MRRRSAPGPLTPLVALLAALAIVAGACGSTEEDRATDDTVVEAPVVPSAPTVTPEEQGPPVEADLGAVRVALEEVGEVEAPTALAARSGTDDLYVTEQSGAVRRISVRHEYAGDGSIRRTTRRVESGDVVDLSERTRMDGEQGLLGLAFSSDGRHLYVDYTDEDGATHVDELPMSRNDRADRDRRRELLVVPQPFPNHNGGQLAVGPDGFLYVAMGDGGGAGDPEGNGQDPATLLGSILRIDPEGALGDQAYTLPTGNPFLLDPRGAPEVWLFGVRNPWRFSFDPETDDLWVADVGQNEVEEITRLPAAEGGAGRGANLGWNLVEGDRPFEGGVAPEGHSAPIFTYPRTDGACAVTGGYVYRGTAIPALRGAYVYGDYCKGEIRALVASGDTVVDEQPLGLQVPALTSFGVDGDGELWALSQQGKIFRIVPA